jgi:antitoxin PrlF
MARKSAATASTTLTSKGQMTLPKSVRERLGLSTGDRLEVAVDGQRIVLTPKTLHLQDICSLLPASTRPATLEEMDEAIARGATGE